MARTTAKKSSVLQSKEEEPELFGGGAPASDRPTSIAICRSAPAMSPDLSWGLAASRIAAEVLGGSLERAPRPARM